MRLGPGEFDQMLVSQRGSLREFAEAIERGGLHLALAVDNVGRLVGLLTDGDVRRALLAGATLDDRAGSHVQRQCVTAPCDATDVTLKHIASRSGVEQVPLLSHSGRVQGLWIQKESTVSAELSNLVVVMAGGKGTRLGTHTMQTPKPLVKVAGIPMLERVILMCANSGVSRFTFAVGHMSDQIVEYFQDGAQWSVSITYVHEFEPLGTAGALGSIPKTESEPILVLNADVLSDVDLRRLLAYHRRTDAEATVCVRSFPVDIPYGVTEVEAGFVTSLHEKPRLNLHVNAGIYVLSPHLLARVREGERLDMTTFLMALVNDGVPVAAYPLHEFWVDAGDPVSLDRATLRFREADNGEF